MAAQCEGGGKDEIKSQFCTREGLYKVMTFSEYRPNRTAGCIGAQSSNHPVKVSFINVPDNTPLSSVVATGSAAVAPSASNPSATVINGGNNITNSATANNSINPNKCDSAEGDRICFNVGRELYFYMYKGIKKAADLTKPIDKRLYKGTYPTCHDFNEFTVSTKGCALLVGFSAGQIQLIDPYKKELSKLFNEDRLIDKSKVTCLKWLPKSPNQFVVSHGSGQMYVYNEDLLCTNTPPHYQLFKQGDGFTIYTCKTKSTRNPLYRWAIGEGSLNEFTFSPCCCYVATASQDGFLRVFNYDTMELVGMARSYFGGLLCVCWSPDGKYVVTGGEDDLVTVWSFDERRVVARGEGHKSWVSVVAFDNYYDADLDNIVGQCNVGGGGEDSSEMKRNQDVRTSRLSGLTCYRFGSVGQDTQLCLWDLTEDVLKEKPIVRSKTAAACNHSNSSPPPTPSNAVNGPNCNDVSVSAADHTTSSTSKKAANQSTEQHKRNFSLGGKNSLTSSSTSSSARQSNCQTSHSNSVSRASGGDSAQLFGTIYCPRLKEVCMLEPLVCKKIAHERLTSLVFRKDSFVTACQEGFILTWARPGRCSTTAPLNISASGNPTIAAIPEEEEIT
ncbi:hypothetical protein CHUAL_006246 [Chamberlinius hualienensis]